jgi:mRNA interferase HicA
MKRRDLEKRLRFFGWRLVRNGSRHDVWSDGEREIVVPRHNEINEYTAKAILKEAGGG